MARGRQKKQAPSRSRPGRYGNGYGTVYMIDKTGCRRKPFVVKIPIGFSKPKKRAKRSSTYIRPLDMRQAGMKVMQC